MGIALLTLREGERLALTPRQSRLPRLVAPVHTSLAEVTTKVDHALDRTVWLLLPALAAGTIVAKSPVMSVLVLAISPALCQEVERLYEEEISHADFERILSTEQLLPRTNWVNEIVHRYLFERAVCKKRDNAATKFLESEIVKELYFVAIERLRSGDDRKSVVEKTSSIVERALAVIDRDPFDPTLPNALAKLAGASSSTLLRAFKREFGLAPLAFIRRRRLDESMLLLKAKRYSVGEVATMVGYRNFAAFSAAFRARFGLRPSDVGEAKARRDRV